MKSNKSFAALLLLVPLALAPLALAVYPNGSVHYLAFSAYSTEGDPGSLYQISKAYYYYLETPPKDPQDPLYVSWPVKTQNGAHAMPYIELKDA